MRVFVTGPTGSGKSTWAAGLARDASLPVYALDDLHWVRDAEGERRRAPADRLALLRPLVEQDHWIIEGVQFKWVGEAIARADRIVVLDVPRWRNTLYILRRFSGRRLASWRHSRATWAALRQELRWCADYHRHERALLLAMLASYEHKVVRAGDHRALRRASAELRRGVASP